MVIVAINCPHTHTHKTILEIFIEWTYLNVIIVWSVEKKTHLFI